jgi:hypothetical protein
VKENRTHTGEHRKEGQDYLEILLIGKEKVEL